MNEQKKSWDRNYGEIYRDWSAKFNFGAKGEMGISEAEQFHIKWKTLGKLAKQGVL